QLLSFGGQRIGLAFVVGRLGLREQAANAAEHFLIRGSGRGARTALTRQRDKARERRQAPEQVRDEERSSQRLPRLSGAAARGCPPVKEWPTRLLLAVSGDRDAERVELRLPAPVDRRRAVAGVLGGDHLEHERLGRSTELATGLLHDINGKPA